VEELEKLWRGVKVVDVTKLPKETYICAWSLLYVELTLLPYLWFI